MIYFVIIILEHHVSQLINVLHGLFYKDALICFSFTTKCLADGNE